LSIYNRHEGTKRCIKLYLMWCIKYQTSSGLYRSTSCRLLPNECVLVHSVIIEGTCSQNTSKATQGETSGPILYIQPFCLWMFWGF